MTCNVGNVDRLVRALFAIVMIGGALYFIPTPVPKTLVLITALLLLASARYGVCYIYKILRISTAPSKSTQPI